MTNDMDLIYIECTDRHDRVNIAAAEYRNPGWRLIAAADNRLEQWTVSADGTPLHEHANGRGRQLVRRSERLPLLDSAHQRYGFTCPRCKRRVTVDGDRFVAVLDVLRRAEVNSISLAAIEARLRN